MDEPFLRFTVIGNPIPKARPRVVGRHAFTPKKTENWEYLVAQCASIACKDVCESCVHVSIVFRRKNDTKADVDNLIKSVLDACNGIVYKDDTQVRSVHASVGYGYGDRAGCDVAFWYTEEKYFNCPKPEKKSRAKKSP